MISWRDKIAPSLIKEMDEDVLMTIIIILKERAKKEVREFLYSPEEGEGEETIKILKRVASQSQESCVSFLEKEVPEIRRFWLTNTIAVVATSKLIEKIAQMPDVLKIEENRIQTVLEPFRAKKVIGQDEKVTWGIERIEAKKIWEQYKGKGVKIGHLDTGIDGDHPDLEGRLDAWAEFDQFGRCLSVSTPHDSGIHGTHTAGTMVGDNSSGVAIGVAPEAKLVSALVLPGGRGTRIQIMAGMEWMIEQDIDVLNMSLGEMGYFGDYELIVKRLVKAGIFPSFSIGNSGLAITGSPGNIREACGVGATDINNKIANFSGGGCLVWRDNAKPVYDIKPNVCAPGVSVFSSIPTPGGKYEVFSGTSMATAHVSGAVALLREARPKQALPVKKLMDILYKTSLDLGIPGRDHRYGNGLIQPLKALEEILKF